MLGALREDPCSPSEPLVESGPMLVDRLEKSLERLPTRGRLAERRVGDRSEHQLFDA